MTPRPRSDFRFLTVDAADLGAAARFIAELNRQTATQCLHCPAASAAIIEASLRREENFPGGWSQWFFKAVAPDKKIVALLGCQPDAARTQSWVWGPWWLPDHTPAECLGPLLEEAVRRLPASMRQIDAFLHESNRAGLKFLRAAGFSLRPVTHIYTAAPGPAGDPAGSSGKEGLPYLRAMHEITFVNLHAASFPVTREEGEQLLAGRDGEHVILAATDGLRLLGYACVSVNHTPLEGFIEYLAVKLSARNHGVGRWLLDQTLHWIFQERRLPQAALCVTEWREGARRLYERAGFRLSASGVGARLRLTPRR